MFPCAALTVNYVHPSPLCLLLNRMVWYERWGYSREEEKILKDDKLWDLKNQIHPFCVYPHGYNLFDFHYLVSAV